MKNNILNKPDRLKVIRFLDYMTRIAALRSKIVRDISDYQQILWLGDIPKQKGCFTQAWGRDENFDTDVWIEVQVSQEPEFPRVPSLCEEWIERDSLRDKSNIPPKLLSKINKQVKNSACQEASSQSRFIYHTEYLDAHPEIKKAWDRYIEENWLKWAKIHNDWEKIQKIYSKLFAIYQEQLRLGEEYELVVALGLLTWKTPGGQRVNRHLIVANAVFEFEARLGKFTVRPFPDGANVRPELDMLDIEEQPARAEEAAKLSLSNGGDDPWNRTCIEAVLQAVVHSISAQGEYDSELGTKSVHASRKPVVEYAPALILRKRSSRGLAEALNQIKKKIENNEFIPSGFRDIAEIRSEDNSGSEKYPGEITSVFDGELFFPKPSNEEQRRIVEKLRATGGVLVQGPPGTGKSHTIANLICHLLATGQRTLITAKTPRALQVLERLVPEELRPLCINLLGSGLEEKKSLESSVNGILRKNEEWHEDQIIREREILERKIRELREDKIQTDRRLRSIRESETHSHHIAGKYRGTAARIAENVNQDKALYDWFKDSVPLEYPCPVSEGDLQKILYALRRFTPEKRRELSFVWPDELPSSEVISDIFAREENADKQAYLIKGADDQIANHLLKLDTDAVHILHDSFSDFGNKLRQLSALPHVWMPDALRDIIGGNSSIWHELQRVTQDIIVCVEPFIPVADNADIEFPTEINARLLLEDTCKLRNHMKNGGKLGWGPFRPKLIKNCTYIFKAAKVNGRFCSTLEQVSILADTLCVHVECEKAWDFWTGRCEKIRGPYILQLHTLKAICKSLTEALSLEMLIEQCRKLLQQNPLLDEPVWTDDSQIQTMIASCRLSIALHSKQDAFEDIHRIESPLRSIVGRANAVHPVTNKLLQAIQNRNIDAIICCIGDIEKLKQEKQLSEKLESAITRLRSYLPKLTVELEQTCYDSFWEALIPHLQDAWCWAQAKFWIEEYIRKEDAIGLAKRVRQIEDEINTNVAKLASLHAWSFCFSRLKENHRRHMEAWRQSMQRLGKGTGKHAPRHRREAQQHLNECREAVPAWVMPLHRVWDTVDPGPEMFDVIIVDEASQCGIESLPLFYLGKKIIIVGDDRQISPEAVGLSRDAVQRLKDEFLHDFNLQSTFDIESSLFDHGKLRYGTRRIILREHFRCMPEIIRFSNELCYSDTPLIPLRQYGPDRLLPLEHIFVKKGYREGSGSRVVNRPEADAICEKIVALCADEQYSGKTMGVIVLQGEAQAGLIEGQLLERLGAEEMELRRLICGNSYSFQGDERDIIFLSMVAATNERIGSFTKPADERRFNVAASRARDQMYLFHSVTCDDLGTSCLRRRLLEFFENTEPQKIAGIEREELERRAAKDNRMIVRPPAPFESWFEIDVALEIARKGFSLYPQYEIAGKRIDIVIEGGQARLAVECDGDKWHGEDNYEADMQRQRQLERCGWEFFRIRESHFYSNRKVSLDNLWNMLEERGIGPQTGKKVFEEQKSEFTESPRRLTCKTVWTNCLKKADTTDRPEQRKVKQDKNVKRPDCHQKVPFDGKVKIGCKVEYIDIEQPEIKKQILIVRGNSEPKKGVVNANTPIAKAFLGASIGDIVEAKLPNGIQELKIEKIAKDNGNREGIV